MGQETINILLGAGIAILASLITATLSYIFQSIDTNRKRIWQLKDAALQQTKYVKEKRIDQIEEILINIMKTSRELILTLTNEKDLFKAIDVVLPALVNNNPRIAPVGILNDSELTNILIEFSKTMEEIYASVTKHGVNAEPADVIIDVLNYNNVLEKHYSHILKRLDELRISITSEYSVYHDVSLTIKSKPSMN